MKKKSLAGLAAGLILFGMGGVANADIFNFHLIGDDNSPSNDLGTQLQVNVTDGSGAVNFTFMNFGNIASVITEVYFDVEPNTLLNFSEYTLTPSGEVFFIEGAHPGDLSGGNTISFDSDWDTEADDPAPTWGINNTTTESLTISFNYYNGQNFDHIISAINSGNLLMGLHVTGIGPDGDSEAYVNNPTSPVPEPSTTLLIGIGIAGLTAVGRRKKA